MYAKCRLLFAPAYDEQIIARLQGRSPAATRFMVSGAVRKTAKSGAQSGQKKSRRKIGGF
jgi:hypothetical protein